MSKYQWSSVVVVLLAVVFGASNVEARQFRVDQVPNNQWECGLCHQGGLGGAPLNDFGKQVEDNLSSPKRSADVDWQAIYDLDADGDGFTNGEELGDPNGDWSEGDPDPEREPTDPNDSGSFPEETGGDTGVESDAGMQADAGDGESDAGGSEPDIGGGESDVGGGEMDASVSLDAGGTSGGAGSGVGDQGCSSTGSGQPAGRMLGLLVVIGGVVALRRRQ